MLITDIAKVLKEEDIPLIINTAFDLLAETGVCIENIELLDILSGHGARIDKNTLTAKFPKKLIEETLATADKTDWQAMCPSFSAYAAIYQGYFLDPLDNEFKEWSLERILTYATLAKALPHIDSISMLGFPAAETDIHKQPLLEKYICWKYDISGGSAIWAMEFCPQIEEMWHVYAAWQGKTVNDVFNGTVYMISPLRFSKEESEQFMYFYKKGIRVGVGKMGSLGVTAPITKAGALAMQLAEGIFLHLLNRFCFNDKRFHLNCSMSVMDMRTSTFQFGRPEQISMNIASAQIAKALGASYSGHEGLSSAQKPGYESAGQKVYSAVMGAMAYGRGSIEAGLLSVDEVYSPIQMILDDEMTGAIKGAFGEITVNDETLAFEVMKEVGPGGSFIAHEHTAEHVRESLWVPSVWTKESFNAWKKEGGKTEIDRAVDKYMALTAKTTPPAMPEEVEKELLAIINKY